VIPALASSVFSVVSAARITLLMARRSGAVKASTLARIPENHHRIPLISALVFLQTRLKMHERVGLIFVQTVPNDIRVALFFNNKLTTAKTSKENPLPLVEAALISKIRGFDPGSIERGLTLCDASRDTEFYFAFQPKGEVQLPPIGEWVSVDKWATSGWAPKRQPFIKEAATVLAAYEYNYSQPLDQQPVVSTRASIASFSREVALEARRPDLIFGLTVLHMIAGHPQLHEFLISHRVDWLNAQNHPRADLIRKAMELTNEMYHISTTIANVNDPLWYNRAVAMLQNSTNKYIQLFYKPCHRFERDVWAMIAGRLLSERNYLITNQHSSDVVGLQPPT
jgi:hypothetical protein